MSRWWFIAGELLTSPKRKRGRPSITLRAGDDTIELQWTTSHSGMIFRGGKGILGERFLLEDRRR
jgi:hypothetical protein